MINTLREFRTTTGARLSEWATDKPKAAARFREVVSSTVAGMTYGAVSKAVRTYASAGYLKKALQGTLIPGCVAAAVIGGVAGVKIVEKYCDSPSRGQKIVGGILGSAIFGGASVGGLAPYLIKTTPEQCEALEELLSPVLANLLGSVASKIVQTSGVNLWEHETTAPGLAKPANGEQIKRDARQAIRCLLESLPRMSLLGIHKVTDSWPGAVLVHGGVGLLGNAFAHVWDFVRGPGWGWDETHLTDNRIIEEGAWKDVATKVGVSALAALGASPIAPALNHTMDVPTGARPVVFAIAGCLVGAVFIGPAQAKALAVLASPESTNPTATSHNGEVVNPTISSNNQAIGTPVSLSNNEEIGIPISHSNNEAIGTPVSHSNNEEVVESTANPNNAEVVISMNNAIANSDTNTDTSPTTGDSQGDGIEMTNL